MELDPDFFAGMANEMGQDVTWARAFVCPCLSATSGAAAPDCPQCKGVGRLWADPVGCTVAMTGVKVAREWRQYGEFESGDAVISIGYDSAAYAAGENDRLVMINSSEPFSGQRTRGANDKLPGIISTIDRVFWLSSDRSAVVEGGIPSVGAGGVLTWASGAPPTGTQYSVTGRRRPEYFVFKDFPQDRAHFHGLPLPRRVVLRKWDLMGRGGVGGAIAI